MFAAARLCGIDQARRAITLVLDESTFLRLPPLAASLSS